jgi:hypothetical protein
MPSAHLICSLRHKKELQYRGRLDAPRMTPVGNARGDLFEAMKQIAEMAYGPQEKFPSMGCSINGRVNMMRLATIDAGRRALRNARLLEAHAMLWIDAIKRGLGRD